MNTVVLIGRLTGEPELKETKEQKERSIIQIAVPRSFKNADGIYETDFFRCILWNGIANRVKEYCKKDLNLKYTPYDDLVCFAEEALGDLVNCEYFFDFRDLE